MPPPEWVGAGRVEQVGWVRWLLQLEHDRNRWRATWVPEHQPDLTCGCDLAAVHDTFVASVRASSDRGWHVVKDDALRYAENQLRYWCWWFEYNQRFHQTERLGRAGVGSGVHRVPPSPGDGLLAGPVCRWCETSPAGGDLGPADCAPYPAGGSDVAPRAVASGRGIGQGPPR